MPVVAGSIEREGLCPRCGGPAVYNYKVEAPIDDAGVQAARFSYEASCLACGFKESKKIYIPLNVAYMLRYMLEPSLRGVLEKAKLIADVRSGLAAAQQESVKA